MSTLNPYAPPGAAVADVHETTNDVQAVRTWSAQGRIGRLRYMAHMVVAYVVYAVIVGAVSGAMAAMGLPLMATIAIGICTIVYVVFMGLKTVQRSHDMDWSGWMSLLAFIPLVGFIWIFKSGSAGNNRYGAPPPPNTMGIRLLALWVPAVAIIGIVAAIAIPAYSDYSKRAKAMQVR